MQLDDTAAIVTGGASGLGAATAAALAAKGAQVFALDLPAAIETAPEVDGRHLRRRRRHRPRAGRGRRRDRRRRRRPAAHGGQLRGHRPVDADPGQEGRARPRALRQGGPGQPGRHLQRARPGRGEDRRHRAARARPARRRRSTPPRSRRTTARSARPPTPPPRAGSSASPCPPPATWRSTASGCCTIAPGIVETPDAGDRLGGVPRRARRRRAVPARAWAGPRSTPQLALSMVEHDYLNGEVVRMDGALRMAPR